MLSDNKCRIVKGFMPLIFEAMNGHSTIIMQFLPSGVCVKHFHTKPVEFFTKTMLPIGLDQMITSLRF